MMDKIIFTWISTIIFTTTFTCMHIQLKNDDSRYGYNFYNLPLIQQVYDKDVIFELAKIVYNNEDVPSLSAPIFSFGDYR